MQQIEVGIRITHQGEGAGMEATRSAMNRRTQVREQEALSEDTQ